MNESAKKIAYAVSMTLFQAGLFYQKHGRFPTLNDESEVNALFASVPEADKEELKRGTFITINLLGASQ